MHRCHCQNYKVLIMSITHTDEEPGLNVNNLVVLPFSAALQRRNHLQRHIYVTVLRMCCCVSLLKIIYVCK